uniref:NADH-ubiquinone oxidoreductase chain 4 n=1 Tax=Ornithodoros waterbergensis TaxID=1580575 RepID=A0A1P8AGC5_9ACAR|nr:NADH dehydrogenase subunit 4 [Ornithodoros waterbergensis]AMX74166.1 NADH dehydrogenase subunit 4 [Ornithodoros waterbergensis]UYL27166.1 NADH dehydrogenase subunit 4 [Ornithodoros waterbergensis]
MLELMFILIGLLVFFWFYTMVEMIVVLMFFILCMIMKMEWTSTSLLYVGGLTSVDLLGFMMIELSIWVGMLMFLASMNLNIFSEKMFSFYIFLMIVFLVLCFSVNNLFFFYLCFESVLFPIVMIIMGWGMQPERLQAGLYMLFYTLFGSFPLLVFILFFKNMNLTYIYWMEFSVGMVMMFMGMMGFLVKMPMYMLHIWLPKAHVEAPVSGSMILAAVLLKLGVYGLIRMIFFFVQEVVKFSYIFMSVAILGGLVISLICLCQIDVKSLIAYSSVCHMGISLGGILSMTNWGYWGNLMMMLGHGLCSSGLFCLANFFYERVFTRSMVLLKGVGVIFPFFSLWWFMFSVINMAAPPSMNLGGEIFLIGSMIKWSFLMIVPVGLISFLTAAYSLYMYSYINHGSGWILFGGRMMDLRELLLAFFHMVPLLLWILKVEFFLEWF